jgi:hypothetical protein
LSVWRSRPSNYCRILSSWYVYLLSSENSFAYQCLSEPAHFRLSHHIFTDLTDFGEGRGNYLRASSIWRRTVLYWLRLRLL